METGIDAGAAAGVLGSRSAEACSAMLGLLRIGAAYVPLDAALPAARLRKMAPTAGVDTTIQLPGETGTLPDEISTVAYGDLLSARSGGEELSLPSVAGNAIAYVMFTSGSAGRPKAVGVTHRGEVRLALDNGFTDLGSMSSANLWANTLLASGSDLIFRSPAHASNAFSAGPSGSSHDEGGGHQAFGISPIQRR